MKGDARGEEGKGKKEEGRKRSLERVLDGCNGSLHSHRGLARPKRVGWCGGYEIFAHSAASPHRSAMFPAEINEETGRIVGIRRGS